MLKITGIKGLFQCLSIGMLGLALSACDDVSDWGKGSSSSSSSASSVTTYTIGGVIKGLKTQNGPVTLLLNNSEYTVSPAGVGVDVSFTFPNGLKTGALYGVSINSDPAATVVRGGSAVLLRVGNPTGQSCTVDQGGAGTVSTSNINNIVVSCKDDKYTIGGSFADLKGKVTLVNSGSDGFSDTLIIDTSGKDDPSGTASFTFLNSMPLVNSSGAAQAYLVTINQQDPGLNCVLTNGSGQLSLTSPKSISSDAGNGVKLTCARSTVAIGANVSGLAAVPTGQQQLELKNVVGSIDTSSSVSGVQPYQETKVVSASGASQFLPVKTGERFFVSLTQPLGQLCSVQPGSGYTATPNGAVFTASIAGNVMTVSGVSQGTIYPGMVISGTNVNANTTIISQLTGGAGGVGTYVVSVSKNVASTTINGTETYNSNAFGTLAYPNDVSIGVSCSKKPYTITVANPDGANVSVSNTTQSNAQSSAPSITFNSTYGDANVAVTAGKVGNSCNVTGTVPSPISGNVVGVSVSCTPNQYNVKVNVRGLSDTGSSYTAPVLGLSSNGSLDSLTLTTPLPTTDTVYTFTNKLAYGSSFNLAVTDAAPKGGPGVPLCVLDSASGTVGPADVILTLTCSADNFSLGGTITGLTGSGLVLQNNGAGDTPITSAGPFTMADLVPKDSGYNVTVKNQPIGQICLVTNGSGTMGTTNIASVSISCNNGTISGRVTGLISGTTITLANGGDSVSVTGNGSDVDFKLPATGAYAEGTPYFVAIQGQQPQGQTCLYSNNSGNMPAGNVTNVVVTCNINSYTVGGTIILADPLASLPAAGMGLSIKLAYTPGTNDVCQGTTTLGVCNSVSEITGTGLGATTCTDPIATVVAPALPPAAKCIAWNFPDQIHFKSPTLTAFTVTTGAQPYGVSCTLYNYSASAGTYTLAGGNPPGINGNAGAGNQNASNVVYYCTATSYGITGTVTGVPANSGATGMQAFNAINLQVITSEGGAGGTQNTYTQQFTGNGTFTMSAPTPWTADNATDISQQTYPQSRILAANNTLVYNANNQLFSVSVGGTCGSPGTTMPTITPTPATGGSANISAVTTSGTAPNITNLVAHCPATSTNGSWPYTAFGTALYSYAGTYTQPVASYSHATGTTYTASLIPPVGYLANNNTPNTADTLGNGTYPLHNTCLLKDGNDPAAIAATTITGTITNGNPNILIVCTPYEVPVTITFNGYASGGTFTTNTNVSLFGTPGPSNACTAAAPACEVQILSPTGTASTTGSTNGSAAFKTYLKPGTTWYATFTQPVMTVSPRTCTLYNAGNSTSQLSVGTSAITSAFGICTLTNPADGFMFVANPGNNTVTQYTFGADGTPTQGATPVVITGSLGPSPYVAVNFNQPTDVAIAANGMTAYVLDSGNAKVNNYNVSSKKLVGFTSALPPPSTSIYSGVGALSGGSQPFALSLVPSGMSAFVTDYRQGVVYGYSVVGGGTGGQLQALSTPYNVTGHGIPVTTNGITVPSSGPRGIAFDPTSTFAYVVNGNDGTVSQFSITGNGLTALGAMGTGGVTLNTFTVGKNPYYAVVEPSGRYLYVTNKDDNTISQFSICQTGSAACPMVGVTPAPADTSSGGSVGGLSALSPAIVSLPAGSTGPVGITANDTSVFVTTSDGKVAQFTIGINGQLTPNASLNTGTVLAGTNPLGIVTAFGSLTGSTTDATPKVYVANQGSDSIQSYLMDPSMPLPYPLINATTPSISNGATTAPVSMAIFK